MRLNRRQIRRMILREMKYTVNESIGGVVAIGLAALATVGFSVLDVYIRSKRNSGGNVARPPETGGDPILYEMFGQDDYQLASGKSSTGASGIFGQDNYDASVERDLGRIPRRVGELVQQGKSDHEAVAIALAEDEQEAKRFLQAVSRLQANPVTGIG
jgi:hypothetical protein